MAVPSIEDFRGLAEARVMDQPGVMAIGKPAEPVQKAHPEAKIE